MNELRLRLSGHVEGHFAASGSHLSSGYFTLNPAFFVKCVLADGGLAPICRRFPMAYMRGTTRPLLWGTTGWRNVRSEP